MSAAVQSPGAKGGTPELIDRFRQLYARRETVRFLVASHLKAGHRDKFLGRIWSLLDPLLFMLVYLLVFGMFFGQARFGGKINIADFIIYLLCGVLSWRFFEGSVSAATGCIRSNRGLIHEISFPKAVFPLSICLSRLSDFLWGLLVLFAVVLVVGPDHLTLHVFWFPLLILLQLMFTLGLAFIVAFLGAFFADTANIVSVTMRLWFYLSPVFYKVAKSEGGIISKGNEALYMLNPIACFFEAYRDCLLRGQMPQANQLFYVTSIALFMLIFGFSIFSRGEGQFAKYV
ncbi:MAG: ABC transporter permease [Phycisphaerales bacterium]|nr:ABC transporter permease [Phycisphaerales bacterium]